MDSNGSTTTSAHVDVSQPVNRVAGGKQVPEVVEKVLAEEPDSPPEVDAKLQEQEPESILGRSSDASGLTESSKSIAAVVENLQAEEPNSPPEVDAKLQAEEPDITPEKSSDTISKARESSKWTPEMDAKLRAEKPDSAPQKNSNAIADEFFPHGKRSLSGIAMRAFCLGGALILGLGLSVLSIYNGSRLWRPCLFLTTLSVFHFLEFYITAAYNTPVAYVASYLLKNGDQYQLANTMAFVETCITSYFFPNWQARFHSAIVVVLGIAMIAVGQYVRSTAMAQAGTNFNHIVQSRKNDGHELVTHGVYAYFRHPSYFGFFWWGIGTQVMLGNAFCLVAYVGILWYFFMRRITHEEKHLVQFFGEQYKEYKEHTQTWIPFIR